MSADSERTLGALGPREAITRAVEILMDRHNVSKIEALELLVRGSSNAHVTVREVASRIVHESALEERFDSVGFED